MLTAHEERRTRELVSELWLIPGGGAAAIKVITCLADGQDGPLLSAIAEGRALVKARIYHRRPRGSPGGGQFASAGGGSVAGPAGRFTNTGPLSSSDAEIARMRRGVQMPIPASAESRKHMDDARAAIAQATAALTALEGRGDHPLEVDQYLYNLGEVARDLDKAIGDQDAIQRARARHEPGTGALLSARGPITARTMRHRHDPRTAGMNLYNR